MEWYQAPALTHQTPPHGVSWAGHAPSGHLFNVIPPPQQQVAGQPQGQGGPEGGSGEHSGNAQAGGAPPQQQQPQQPPPPPPQHGGMEYHQGMIFNVVPHHHGFGWAPAGPHGQPHHMVSWAPPPHAHPGMIPTVVPGHAVPYPPTHGFWPAPPMSPRTAEAQQPYGWPAHGGQPHPATPQSSAMVGAQTWITPPGAQRYAQPGPPLSSWSSVSMMGAQQAPYAQHKGHHGEGGHKSSSRSTKEHKCTWEGCPKTFGTSSDLNKHLRTHTGERPYECPHDKCEKRFKQLGDLNRHKRTHTGEKPYVCTHPGCGNGFTRLNNYKKHMKTQHEADDDRPYICQHPGCNRQFQGFHALEKHQRTSHDEGMGGGGGGGQFMDPQQQQQYYGDPAAGMAGQHHGGIAPSAERGGLEALDLLQRASKKARHDGGGL